jgi:hypothetical protein
MDSHQRPRSHTSSGDDQDSNKEHRGSFSKETKHNKRTSLPPGFNPIFFPSLQILFLIISGSLPPINNSSTGKSWLKFFGSQQSKQ